MHFFLGHDFGSTITWQPAPKIYMQIIKNKTNLMTTVALSAELPLFAKYEEAPEAHFTQSEPARHQECRSQGQCGCLTGPTWLYFPSCPLPTTLRKGRDAPEGNIVHAHARQHDQEAVPQHPLVVSVLLLPRLWSLRPHMVKLGPVLCIGGSPGAAGREKKGQRGDEVPQETWRGSG